VLTLAVVKNTYERLGLVGEKLPWKACNGTFVIHISLHEEAPESAKPAQKWHRLGPKQTAALREWDARRGPWKIMYNFQDSGQVATGPEGSAPRGIKSVVRKAYDVYIPDVRVRPRPRADEQDSADYWDEDMSSLFEWIGMAGLGAQRLQANDRPDSYLSVYVPPAPSHVGSITHIRWTGLLPPAFVQSVIDAAITGDPGGGAHASFAVPFLSFVGHGVPGSPVGYIPPGDSRNAPLRAPRPESEDTWSLILSNNSDTSTTTSPAPQWALAESIGQWDTRWG